jgi:hypothetical protein
MSNLAVLDSPEAIRTNLEAVIAPEDRGRRSAWFFLCDDANRGLVTACVDDLPATLSMAECRHAVSVFAEPLACRDGGAMLVALTRRGPASITATDRNWYHAVHEICADQDHAIRVLGVHLVTPQVNREIASDDLVTQQSSEG